MIRISGFSGERFLSMAAYRGARLWDVVRDRDGLRLCAARRDLPLLRVLADKAGCVLTVSKEAGWPALRHRYRRRKVFAVGAALFLTALYLLSSVIWTVSVVGNDRVSKAEVLSVCTQTGLFPGAWKRRVDTLALSETLLRQLPDLRWSAVTIHGTHATVRVVETLPEPELVDRESPVDLAASKAGVVQSIAASAGTPLVRAGDVAKAGQILVSGKVTILDMDQPVGEEYVHASARVTARVWYELWSSIALTQDEKVYNGPGERHYALLLGNRVLEWPQNQEELSETEVLSENWLKLGDYCLPVGLRLSRTRTFVWEGRTMTEEEAQDALRREMGTRLDQLLPDAAILEQEDLTFSQEGDTLKAKGVYMVLERIETEREISIQEESAIDGENSAN